MTSILKTCFSAVAAYFAATKAVQNFSRHRHKAIAALPKAIAALCAMFLLLAANAQYAFANPLLQNDIMTGANNFVRDVIPAAGLAGAIGGIAVCGISLFQRSVASEDEASRYNKRIKVSLFLSAVCGLIGGSTFLFDVITHYTPVVLP